MTLLPGAGSRPGGRGTFLCFAKEKYPKERRPCCACPSAALRATCDARLAGAAAELTARWRAPFKHAAASQSTKCVCPSAHARTHRPALLCTHRREWVTSRAIATLGPVLGAHCALQAPQRKARACQAERSNGPCAAPHPCWLRLPRSDSEGVADWGSPFLCLLSFGEAKESECAAGRTSRPREATAQQSSNQPAVKTNKPQPHQSNPSNTASSGPT